MQHASSNVLRSENRRFFEGGGELGALMRAKDWSLTPLDAASRWPRSLRATVQIILRSRQPMVVWWGRELVTLYNDAYRAILGHKHPRALGLSAPEVWPEIWDQISTRVRDAMENGSGSYDAARLLVLERHGYPEETYQTFSCTPVPDDEGNAGGVLCATVDETRRVFREREIALLAELGSVDAASLEEAYRLCARALETDARDVPFALLYTTDAGGNMILAGAAGIDARHRAAPFRAALDDAHAVWPFAEVLTGERAVEIDDLRALQPLPAGAWSKPPARAIAVPISRPATTGRAILIAGLSPFRRLDPEYRGLIGSIAAAIAARLEAAEAAALERVRAQGMVEADATRRREEFLALLGHELRNPLAPILTALQLLRLKSPTSGERECAVIERNVQHMMSLLDDLLDVSRITRGKLTLRRIPVELWQVVSRGIEMVSPLLDERGHYLEVAVPRTGLMVDADPTRLAQVVSNLLSNAAKYTQPSGRIRIEAQRDGGSVVMRVLDNGMGITASMLPRIFDLFVQERQALDRSPGGLGLGLAIVRNLVQMHGGSAHAESAGKGKGSMFTVRLPTGTLSAAPDPNASEPSAIEPKRSRERVLIVDDNRDAAEMLGLALEHLGYQVRIAHSGPEALQISADDPPQIALIDIGLPVMDGYELAERLRSRNGERIKLIAVTGYGQESDRQRSRMAGIDAHLVKPVSFDHLARVMESPRTEQ